MCANNPTAYLKAGLSGQNWYRESGAIVRDIFETDAELFIDILAATSANSSVAANVTKALKHYQRFKNNKGPACDMPIVENMLRIIFNNHRHGFKEPFGGDKIQQFSAALKGDEQAIVVDIWMLRAFKFPNITPKRIEYIKKRIKRLAREHGLTPAQAQACIWTGIKMQQDNRRKNKLHSFADILQTMGELKR